MLSSNMGPSFNVYRSQLLSEISVNMYFEIIAQPFHDVINFEIFIQPTLAAMADRAERRGREKNEKHDNLRTKRALYAK